MLLQRLVEYANSTDEVIPPFYGRKPVRWVLRLNTDGTPRSGELTDLAEPAVAGRRFGVPHLVPAVTRTAGVAPALAADNVEYVFGWVGDGANAERVPKQHEAFRELILDWAAAEPDGPASAIAAFYAAGADRTIAKPPGWGRADLVAFEVGDDGYAAEHKTARRYWATVAAGRKGLGRTGTCLVCGQQRDLLKTIPQQIPRRLLPGATQGASLVSVNEAVHGYELTKFLAHTPICITCGLTFMSSLTALLDSERHSYAIPGQNARLAWWLVGGSSFDVMTMLDNPTIEEVGTLLASPAAGAPSTLDDVSTFCAVTVGGNVARVVVRDWVEQPLPQVKENLRDWFADHEMVDWTGAPVWSKLVQLVRAAGRWQTGRGGAPGSWVKLGARGEDRPAGLWHALWRSAALRRPLPPHLLAHVVGRIRTDGRVDVARASLIRLALRRDPTLSDEALKAVRERLTPELNTQEKDPAYLSGRIFAVLDDLQQAVYRAAKQPINTTFAERYMGRAITNPQSVLVSSQRLATAWQRRLRGPLRRPSWAEAYGNRLADLYAQFEPGEGIPGSAVLNQKAYFILGYHQQRAMLRKERNEAAERKRKTDLPPDEGTAVDPDQEQPDHRSVDDQGDAA